MSIVLKPAADQSGVVLMHSFHCPGCDRLHVIHTAGPGAWDWNGSVEKPTFTPSFKEEYPHWVSGKVPGIDEPQPSHRRVVDVCHSFIAEGVIDFLDDCTHALRGKHALPPHPRVAQADGS